MDPKLLRELANETMPFGKYAGQRLMTLPIAYLVWMQNKGWPAGPLGEKLALVLEIKHNGLGYLLKPLVEEGGTTQ
ncbi:DUF3820 family protein [Ferrimonas marina]|uniref:DUF3820 family protein n=1 Tax=Ferrimonas marina TaxID=299255 RepID=A0A1M5Z6E6_9GAMM|nr:DUF3820 family protein [Ferrimonas marina]SHI19826.1 hypothetical protein SAMN02745129_4750 [Ferrimonas marina]